MDRRRATDILSVFISFVLLVTYIQPALPTVGSTEVITPPSTTREPVGELVSNYTDTPPTADGNLSDWSVKDFSTIELFSEMNKTQLQVSFGNNRTHLFIALEGKNMTFPWKKGGGGPAGPVGDMFLMVFDTETDGFNQGDNALVFSVFWNETGKVTNTTLDTYLEKPIQWREEGSEFNSSGDPQQDGDLAINFTGPHSENATGDYVIELSFPLNSGEEWDFNISEGFDRDYGFDYLVRMWDMNDDTGYSTDALRTELAFLDTDGDDYPDLWEEDLGSNKSDPADFPLDTDWDLLPDAYDDDDDDDGYSDATETAAGSNPKDSNDVPPDVDGDGVPDVLDEDTDGDGFSDWDEAEAGTNATDPSSHPEIVVEDLIDNGLDWLAKKQDPDGSWYGETGITGLCLLSFLNNNVTEGNATVDAAVTYILDRIDVNWTDQNPIGDEGRGTYYSSIVLLALKATLNPAYQSEIEALGEWLLWSQWDQDSPWENVNASDWRYGGFGYGGHSRPDLSNTQWALMALDAYGVPKNDTMWDKARYFVERCQYLPEYNDMAWAHNDSYESFRSGGFVYLPDNDKQGPHGWQQMEAYGSMTAAGVWSLMLTGLNRSDVRVRAGLDWIERNYSWEGNPNCWESGIQDYAEYYYFLSLAKALTMLGIEVVNVHDSSLADNGPHVWKDDMVENLTAKKELNESYWVGGMEFMENIPELATAYSLLALETKTIPAGANLSAVFTLRSNATLHLYDKDGRHVGIFGDLNKIEVGIPGAEFTYGGHTYSYAEELQPVQGTGGTLERIRLPIDEAKSYDVELVGISNGSYELEIKGFKGADEVTSETFPGQIVKDRVHSTQVVLTSMDGPLTILSQEPGEIPSLSVSPSGMEGHVEPDDTFSGDILLTEASGLGALSDIALSSDGLSGDGHKIPESAVVLSPDTLSLDAGTTTKVDLFVEVPAGQAEAVYTGRIKIEHSLATRFIPVTLAVTTPDLSLSSADTDKEVEPGEKVTYILNVTNLALISDKITLEAEAQTEGWSADLSVSSISLGPAGSGTGQVEVSAPDTAEDGDQGLVKITATSGNRPALTREMILDTTVNITAAYHRISFGLGPFEYKNGDPIVNATVTLENSVEPENLTAANQTLVSKTNGTGVANFLALPGLLYGNLTKGEVTFSFNFSLLVSHGGTVLNASVVNWTAPAKPTPPPKYVTVTLGPFEDADGNPIEDAGITLTVGDFNHTKISNPAGFVEFSIPVKWKGEDATVKFEHSDYGSAEGTLLGVDTLSIAPDNLAGWTVPEKVKGGGEDDEKGGGTWILIAIVIVVVIILVALIFTIKRGGKAGEPHPPAGPDEDVEPDFAQEDDWLGEDEDEIELDLSDEEDWLGEEGGGWDDEDEWGDEGSGWGDEKGWEDEEPEDEWGEEREMGRAEDGWGDEDTGWADEEEDRGWGEEEEAGWMDEEETGWTGDDDFYD